MTSLANRPPIWAVAALFVAVAALFSAAYCQAPLYYSNQNQYFLHGLAHAGEGTLNEDRLANTKDPTPAFSWLVEKTARLLPRETFHVYYALLLGVYAASLTALFFWLAGPDAARRWPVFLALLFLTHCALLRWLSHRLFAFDYPWFLQAGLAGQYVLGPMLQPSSFGVLLVAAVALFACDRPLWAAAALGVGAAMHSTYLLPAALLTLGFQTVLLRERRFRTALAVGAIALILVLPSVVYALYQFRPTDPETFRRSQEILVNFRIPHHARPDLWIDPVAALQIAWMVLAVFLIRKTRLFAALAVPFALAALLTLVQVLTRNDTLALLFPWRLSAVLMPVATAVILSRLVMLPRGKIAPLPQPVSEQSAPSGATAVPAVNAITQPGQVPSQTRLTQPWHSQHGADSSRSWIEGWPAWIVSAVVIVALAKAGVLVSVTRSAFRGDDGELGVLAYVRQHRAPGETYFLPVEVPNLAAKTRGSLSSDFKPLAEKKHDPKIIPIGLQGFRLHAGAPIYVDFKSIPYQDVEVIEWRERLQIADAICSRLREGHVREAVEELRKLNVTHLVWSASQKLLDAGLKVVYEDATYRVYLVLPAKAQMEER
jgi:hypothetical protein